VGFRSFSSLLGLFACAAPQARPVPELHHLLPRPDRDRHVQELDATRDGRIDRADAEAWRAANAAAAAYLDAVGDDAGLGGGYYHGAPADQAPILPLVRFEREGWNVDQVPAERARELFIETRWAALQSHALATIGIRQYEEPSRVGGVLVNLLAGYNADTMAPADVCAAIDAFDVTPWRATGLPAIAIFDLDSTVWGGNITDVFISVLSEVDLVPQENKPILDALLVQSGLAAEAVAAQDLRANLYLFWKHATDRSLPEPQRISAKDAFYTLVALLRGVPVEAVRELAARVYADGTKQYAAWSDRVLGAGDACGMLGIIEKLRARGFMIYLLSATVDFLGLEGARRMGVPIEQVGASVLALADGRYTGDVADSSYYSKGSIVRQWLPSPPLLAFGDSPTSDFTMLREALVAGFMVNPRKGWADKDEQVMGRLVSLALSGEPQ
jgi:phosphoserine phosphatase